MPTDIPLVGPIVNRIFGTRNERFVRRYTSRVEAIGALEADIRTRTDEELRARTGAFRERFEKEGRGSDLLVEAFAVAREVMDRSIGIRNIFNPKHADAFPLDRLSSADRALYDETLARINAIEPAPPTGPFLGCLEPQAGWMQVEIPARLYEAVREMLPESRPPFRARPFDVQLIGGMVLYQGKIAEMKTGEGKTIVAPLACYLASIMGYKVHVVTVNDYLVQRDRDWTFPYFHWLGLTVGAIHPMHMQPEDLKRSMYQCDVVYGTTSEFGFDYLRDNMKQSADAQVQRVREFAIVDEVDSTLIDEARTPLIISGPAHETQPRYEVADELARHLVAMQADFDRVDRKVEQCKRDIKGTEGDIRNARDKSAVPALHKKLEEFKQLLPRLQEDRDQHTQYYEAERDRKSVHLTHLGIAQAQRKANIGSFYVGGNMDVPHLLEQALRAHVIYERDKDYVVMPTPNPQTGQQEPDVVIVDVNTGRAMVGRQWSDGLHQAIQVKEGLKVRPETQTVATITIQNFFKMYKRLAGMTGTADTEAQEFHDIYKLDVVTIPTNLPVVRRDHDDVIYLSGKDKWTAIVEEIKAFHDMGIPVLVGTTSVERSESLSKMLTSRHGIRHEVLNAKQHEREANIVEGAGRLGAVMIATNMAGRGTDIKLGRITREQLLDHWLKRGIAPRDLSIDDPDETLREKIYRKIAPRELGLRKAEATEMPADELELRLLRHWASELSFADTKRIGAMNADEIRKALDESGRTLMHRIRWVESIDELGGLHVIGTARHESRRLATQLRGRSGRQGDNGSSRFFVAMDDDLMQMFAGETTLKILSRLGMKEGDSIEHPMMSKSLVRAQRKVEERNFSGRKNILEYDEIMEHQRQDFYGMRQRVLDGRKLKELIFDFIERAVYDAVGRYLDKDYTAECVAEFAREHAGCSVPVERLRHKDRDELKATVRKAAREEADHEIAMTLGEYLPAGGDEVDQDLKGLSAWAMERFNVRITAAEVHEMSRRDLVNRLQEAASDQIDQADLTDIGQFCIPDHGAASLVRWLKDRTGIMVEVSEVAGKETADEVVELILAKVEEAYARREVEYPVRFRMSLTLSMMQQDPRLASANFVTWANRRFNLGWDDSILRTKMPQQIEDDLIRASRKFAESDDIDKAVEEALACRTRDELEAHFREKYDTTLPHYILRLHGEDRDELVRARVQSILREELVFFERAIMLEVLDPAWKDHLYRMDQLRDTIGFRAFSQSDPRIEYKREGARLYDEMLASLRDRVIEYTFTRQPMPRFAPRPMNVSRRPAPLREPAGAPTRLGSGSITGPGLDTPLA